MNEQGNHHDDVTARIGSSAAARVLGVSKQHLHRLSDDGKLTPIRTQLGRLFDPEEVELLATEREREKRERGTRVWTPMHVKSMFVDGVAARPKQESKGLRPQEPTATTGIFDATTEEDS